MFNISLARLVSMKHSVSSCTLRFVFSNKFFRLIAFGISLVLLLTIIDISFKSEPSQAVTASDWSPGYIISDSNFYNSEAMSAQEIQNFLNTKVATCRNSNCLKEFRQTTASTTLSYGTCSPYQGAENESAAQIIFKVQKACGISAKALLVILQKEQGLITSSGPSDTAMRSAIGNACPDTGPCDPAYSGFFMQLYSGARQLALYGNPDSIFTWIRVGANNEIRFHPDVDCGTSTVFIRNRATAALYYYTPYQPNAAALANMTSTGDGCSAYGNRNFWRFFNDWFGSPTGDPNMSFDSATGVWGGINVSGWAKNENGSNGTKFLWVNVDGIGRAVAANQNLDWFDIIFPGQGANHGFKEFFSASPGSHSVCVYYSKLSGDQVSDCKYVYVPGGIGNVDSYTPQKGGVRITGWSADITKSGTQPSYIWVKVNGSLGSAYATNRNLSWLAVNFPGTSTGQGFDLVVPTGSGPQSICIYGAFAMGNSESFGCQTVEVPLGQGSLDSIVGTGGGINISGWYVDYTRDVDSFIWVDIDGKGSALITNTERNWLPTIVPNSSTRNGFDYFFPATKGTHKVCVYGANSGMLLGCKSVDVPYTTAGHIDSAQVRNGNIEISGWAADLQKTTSSYVWVNVNGKGNAYLANQSTPWFETLFPGRGSNHGFNLSVPAENGNNQVCIYVNSAQVDCKDVQVSSDQGHLDSVTAVPGGVKISGWNIDFLGNQTNSFIWVDSNGIGQPLSTNVDLPWLNILYPGHGTNHGFEYVIPANKTGIQKICVKSARSAILLGCENVNVPYLEAGSLDSVQATSGTINVSGWAVDLRLKTSGYVWINIDGMGRAYAADSVRAWFDALFAGYGPNHGFDLSIPASTGTHEVCAYVLKTKIGCRTVNVP